MPNTLIVGIDISSQSNSIFFIDDAGNHLIKKPFSLPNDQEGANELIKRVIDCLSQYNLSYVKFGMEATSHYAWYLHLYLASSSELLPYKPTFYVLNPSIVKGFKKHTLPCSKQTTSIQLSSLNVSGSVNSILLLFQTLNMLRYNALSEGTIILFTI